MKMLKSISNPTLILILLQKTTSQRPPYGWTIDTYPTPNSESCFTKNDNSLVICDPDTFLTENDLEGIFSDDFIIPKLKETNVCLEKEDGELEIVIAFAEKTDFSRYHPDYHHRSSFTSRQKDEDDYIIKASRSFTMSLHNKWGIGKPASCGDTGILVYISMADRVVYISKGSALNELLIPVRIDTIINKMKPYLRSSLYKEAVEITLGEILTQIEKGNPNFFEKHFEILLSCGVLAVFGAIFVGNDYIQSRKRRRYAEARMHLSQLDRDNALALQGQYRCTSCPICFESFQNSSSSNASTNDTTEGDDANNESEPMINNQDDNTMKGSDGLPLRLLRCGHVFDETCYNTWISEGQGDVTKCPICKEDIGGTATNDTTNDSTTSIDSDNSTGSASNLHRRTTASSLFRNNRNYDYYRHERLFRLSRLAYRYPQYIRPYQVNRWSDVGYNGRLVQDDGFVRSDPIRQARASSTGSSRSYSSSSSGRSFGGGRSSGGGGGRF